MHAHIFWTGSAYFIKSVSPTYRTWVDGEVLKQNQQIEIRHKQELIFGANNVNDHVKVLFTVDNLPLALIWRDMELTFLLKDQGNIRTFTMKDNDQLQIGRRSDNYQCQRNELFFSNTIVSRDHAVIVYENGFLGIRDLDSQNGTYVNGVLIRKDDNVRLINGAEIQLGATEASESSPTVMKILFKRIQEPLPAPRTARSIKLKQYTTFTTLTTDTKVLLSSFHQGIIGDDCQDPEYLDKQWLTMAVAAIVRSTTCQIE